MLADQHIHSRCSEDGSVPMKELAAAAAELGLDHICFTDHCDMEYYATGEYNPDCPDREKLMADFEEAAAAWGKKISLCLGIELGGAAHMPDRARKILSDLTPDLVIGSVHSFAGEPDFYMYGRREGQFENEEKCSEILGRYVRELCDLVLLGDFDVMGHIGYPLRYIKREGFDMNLSGFYLELENLFRIIIEKGKGIEVNTSGLRNELKNTMPSRDILRLYKKAGGEIITVGSDAHDAVSVGAGIREACRMLEDEGFRYLAVYRERKPEFYRL